MNNVISFSGGKDSTALALLMLEKGVPIHSVVAFDTGWEFPQMLDHWAEFESKTGLEIVRIHPPKSFEYWMLERPVVARNGPNKGLVRGHGNGWPSPLRRWCTREKVAAIRRYLSTIDNAVSCVGFASDEVWRTEGIKLNQGSYLYRYPLIEWGITEAAALKICRQHGYEWGGLYRHFKRASCFCCPLQKIGDLRVLRREYPEQWATMLKWDAKRPKYNGGFKDDVTVHDLEARFAEEDKQVVFPVSGFGYQDNYHRIEQQEGRCQP